MMKRVIEMLFGVFVLISLSVMYLQYGFVSELKKQITDRDSTITKYEANDSIYNSRLKQYTDTVEKYISPSFAFGDKNISVEELLKLTNSSIKEADLLKYQLSLARDSINRIVSLIPNFEKKVNQALGKYQDSVFIYKNYLELAKQYGFKFSHSISGNRYKFSVKAEQVDSALMLLPYFRDRLMYNSEKGCWEIETKKGLFHSRKK